jgi:hypothetical protein
MIESITKVSCGVAEGYALKISGECAESIGNSSFTLIPAKLGRETAHGIKSFPPGKSIRCVLQEKGGTKQFQQRHLPASAVRRDSMSRTEHLDSRDKSHWSYHVEFSTVGHRLDHHKFGIQLFPPIYRLSFSISQSEYESLLQATGCDFQISFSEIAKNAQVA